MERKNNVPNVEQSVSNREILRALLKESEERGVAYYLLEGDRDWGQVSLVGNEQKLHLCYAYAGDKMTVYDWAQVGELAVQSEIPLVLDSKRITKEGVQAILPKYVEGHYPELSKLAGQLVTDEEVGYGNEYVGEFDFNESERLLNEFITNSKAKERIEIYYDSEFDIADHVDIYGVINRQSSVPVVTLYGRNYIPELAREHVDPEAGNRHYVVDTDILTHEAIVHALPLYFSERWVGSLDKLPIEVTEAEKEPSVDNPVSGFKDGRFSLDNWGDPTVNYIREPLRLDYDDSEHHSLFYFGQEISNVELIHKQGESTLGIFRAVDVRGLYGAGKVIVGTSQEQRYALVHSSRADKWFYVSWYKHRSNTEAINYLLKEEGTFSQGEPITYDDAVFLGNFLNEIELKVPDKTVKLKTLYTHEELQH